MNKTTGAESQPAFSFHPVNPVNRVYDLNPAKNDKQLQT